MPSGNKVAANYATLGAGKVSVVSASGKGKYSAGKTTDKVALDKFSAVIFKIGD